MLCSCIYDIARRYDESSNAMSIRSKVWVAREDLAQSRLGYDWLISQMNLTMKEQVPYSS